MFQHFTPRLIFAIFAAAVGGSLQQGFSQTCLNAPAKHMIHWSVRIFEDAGPPNCTAENGDITTTDAEHPCASANLTHGKPYKEDDRYYSYLVSIFMLGAMFGSILSGMAGDVFGRKRAIIYNNLLAFVSTTLMVISYDISSRGYWTFLIGRLISGFNSGLNSGLVPTYLIEISPTTLRGLVAGYNTLFSSLGLFIATFIGIFLGECGKWNTIFFFPYVPIAICIVILPFCPESPRYFLKFQKHEKKAEDTLRLLRKTEHDVDAEMDTLRLDTAREEQADVTFLQMVQKPYRWPLLICVAMMAGQQFIGVNAVNYYSTNIFKNDVGMDDFAAKCATSGLMLIIVFCGLLALWLVDRPWLGRRTMALIGLTGCCVTMLLLFGMLYLLDCQHYPDFPRMPSIYIAVGLIIAYIVLFNAGLSPVVWVVLSESFHSVPRAKASAIAACVNWFCNFVVGLLFNPLKNSIGVYVFLIFVVLGGLFTLFIFLYVPETKGKTVEHLSEEWKRGIVACWTEIRHRDVTAATADELDDSSNDDTLKDIVHI